MTGDAPVSEGVAEQIVGFTVPAVKEELAKSSASGARPRAHCGADFGIPRGADQREIA